MDTTKGSEELNEETQTTNLIIDAITTGSNHLLICDAPYTHVQKVPMLLAIASLINTTDSIILKTEYLDKQMEGINDPLKSIQRLQKIAEDNGVNSPNYIFAKLWARLLVETVAEVQANRIEEQEVLMGFCEFTTRILNGEREVEKDGTSEKILTAIFNSPTLSEDQKMILLDNFLRHWADHGQLERVSRGYDPAVAINDPSNASEILSFIEQFDPEWETPKRVQTLFDASEDPGMPKVFFSRKQQGKAPIAMDVPHAAAAVPGLMVRNREELSTITINTLSTAAENNTKGNSIPLDQALTPLLGEKTAKRFKERELLENEDEEERTINEIIDCVIEQAQAIFKNEIGGTSLKKTDPPLPPSPNEAVTQIEAPLNPPTDTKEITLEGGIEEVGDKDWDIKDPFNTPYENPLDKIKDPNKDSKDIPDVDKYEATVRRSRIINTTIAVAVIAVLSGVGIWKKDAIIKEAEKVKLALFESGTPEEPKFIPELSQATTEEVITAILEPILDTKDQPTTPEPKPELTTKPQVDAPVKPAPKQELAPIKTPEHAVESQNPVVNDESSTNSEIAQPAPKPEVKQEPIPEPPAQKLKLEPPIPEPKPAPEVKPEPKPEPPAPKPQPTIVQAPTPIQIQIATRTSSATGNTYLDRKGSEALWKEEGWTVVKKGGSYILSRATTEGIEAAAIPENLKVDAGTTQLTTTLFKTTTTNPE